MLEKVEYKSGEYTFPSLLVLGCFDAIHIGHRELLKKAKLQAKINGLDLGVMLFKDGKGGKCIYTVDERIKILESYNVKYVLLVDFNDEFKDISANDFIVSLCDQLNVKAFMSGSDYRFGKGAKGKSSTLKKFCEDEENGVWYMPVKDKKDEAGEKISTSNIKSLLENGKIEEANELLGSTFSISGKVVGGHKRGASLLGYPTANVAYPENKLEVKQGVYKVCATIDGNTYLGVANYGTRPTFDETDKTLEIYFEGLHEDIYDKTLCVEFLSFIRDIKKCDTVDELKEQIKKDRETIISGEPASFEPVPPTAVNEEDEEFPTISGVLKDYIGGDEPEIYTEAVDERISNSLILDEDITVEFEGEQTGEQIGFFFPIDAKPVTEKVEEQEIANPEGPVEGQIGMFEDEAAAEGQTSDEMSETDEPVAEEQISEGEQTPYDQPAKEQTCEDETASEEDNDNGEDNPGNFDETDW